jgi:hypothetical protein
MQWLYKRLSDEHYVQVKPWMTRKRQQMLRMYSGAALRLYVPCRNPRDDPATTEESVEAPAACGCAIIV